MKVYLVLGFLAVGFFGGVSTLLMKDSRTQEETQSAIKGAAEALSDPKVFSAFVPAEKKEPKAPEGVVSKVDRKPASEPFRLDRDVFLPLKDEGLGALVDQFQQNPEAVASFFKDLLASSRARDNPEEYSNVMDHLVNLAALSQSMDLAIIAKTELNHQFENSKSLSREQMALFYSWKQTLESH